MPVHLLDSLSPIASTLGVITFGQTGTPDCKPPCLVRVFFLNELLKLEVFKELNPSVLFVCLFQR